VSRNQNGEDANQKGGRTTQGPEMTLPTKGETSHSDTQTLKKEKKGMVGANSTPIKNEEERTGGVKNKDRHSVRGPFKTGVEWIRGGNAMNR